MIGSFFSLSKHQSLVKVSYKITLMDLKIDTSTLAGS
jgi:hypothetical protein